MRLSSLIEDLQQYPGIRRKKAVGRILRGLEGVWDFGDTILGPGDDAAVLKTDRGRYLLLAADSILPLLVREDPYNAGRSAVLVNANDIYAMGGRPLAMVNLLSGQTEDQEAEILRGMRDECARLRVPMVGGHVSPEGDSPFLAAAVVGEAAALLADRNAGPGQEIVLALDLRGRRWGDFLLNWDSHGAKEADTLCEDLGLLCTLAEESLVVAAKDVSNAGILGSLAMLLEQAGVGASVDLECIRVPDPFSLSDWLKVYPSYGFLLLCDPSAAQEVLERFHGRGIWANRIGKTNRTSRLLLQQEGEEGVLFDFSCAGIF